MAPSRSKLKNYVYGNFIMSIARILERIKVDCDLRVTVGRVNAIYYL